VSEGHPPSKMQGFIHFKLKINCYFVDVNAVSCPFALNVRIAFELWLAAFSLTASFNPWARFFRWKLKHVLKTIRCFWQPFEKIDCYRSDAMTSQWKKFCVASGTGDCKWNVPKIIKLIQSNSLLQCCLVLLLAIIKVTLPVMAPNHIEEKRMTAFSDPFRLNGYSFVAVMERFHFSVNCSSSVKKCYLISSLNWWQWNEKVNSWVAGSVE